MKRMMYRRTNCFFIESRSGGLLAFDAGWPCSLREYRRAMKTIGLRFEDVRWAIVSHMHMDHAGLLGEFIAGGIECFAFEGQREAVAEMERIIVKNAEYRDYRPIDQAALRSVSLADFAGLLERNGIPGEAIATRGHSPDSVSFLTGEGEALIGDLAPIDQVMDDDLASRESWALIEAKGATRIYPSHAGAFRIAGIEL